MNEQTMPSMDIEDSLRALDEAFAARVASELPELAERARALPALARTPQREHAALRSIRDGLHKLAGGAGSFGFAELGAHARRLEALAEDALAAAPGQTDDIERLAQELTQLAQAPLRAEPDAVPSRLHASRRHEADTRRVGVVEPDAEFGEAVRSMLENFGYLVRRYPSVAALEADAPDALPDVLVLELTDPAREREMLLALARFQQGRKQALPAIVAGGRVDDFASQLLAVRAGAVAYLSGPLDFPKLEDRIERCFARRQGEAYKVLIVDDDRELARRYAVVLEDAGMQAEIVHAPRDVLAAACRFRPEVILLDVHMPECSGPELAQMLRLSDDWMPVPIVYLSAETDIARQMSALLRAGDDFVTKPLSDHALIATVFAHAQRARLLGNALSRDSLTGLLKHGDIKECVVREVERARRTGHVASVVMLDIDHFKRINDTYGHAAGDNVIRTLANLLRQRLRRTDNLGRYGGEEFLLVLPDCSAGEALRKIEEIRLRFSELRFHVEDQQFSATLSAGIATIDSNSTAEQARERADQALYSAKRRGRNLVECG